MDSRHKGAMIIDFINKANIIYMETMILKDTENGNVSTKIETWTYLISTYAMNISNYFVSSPPALFFDARDSRLAIRRLLCRLLDQVLTLEQI